VYAVVSEFDFVLALKRELRAYLGGLFFMYDPSTPTSAESDATTEALPGAGFPGITEIAMGIRPALRQHHRPLLSLRGGIEQK